jgi:hypothetical protein
MFTAHCLNGSHIRFRFGKRPDEQELHQLKPVDRGIWQLWLLEEK